MQNVLFVLGGLLLATAAIVFTAVAWAQFGVGGRAALLVVLAGAQARLRAPVLLGGGVLVLVALHELSQAWDLIPRWIPLAAGGLLLVLLAMTLERRRRDLERFRAAIARMS